MDLQTIIQIDQENYMNTFGARTPVCLTHGEGVKVYDTEGKAYMDFFAGIAVNSLGHGHPALVKAVTEQASKLIHCSNLYYNEPQAKLAAEINKLAGGGHKVFFANSGAEANEAAIKLARAYFNKKGMPEKNEIITMHHSFHGRTVTTVTATAQPKYQKYFTPLTPGFSYVEPNDTAALEAAVSDNTCAIMLELIQGESGVHPMEAAFLQKVKEICKEKNVLLIVDEVQTGIGRTGSMFAWEQFDVKPDIFTLAKALGGGVPIGAACAKEDVAAAFAPGDHGTTFGGNPLACAAGLAVLSTIKEEGLLENASRVGSYFKQELEEKLGDTVTEIRGKGLMIGIELKAPVAAQIKNRLFEEGYLVGNVGANTLRVLPPLILTQEQVDGFVDTLTKLVKEEQA